MFILSPDIYMKSKYTTKNENHNLIAGKLFPAIISFVLLVFLDQFTKYIIINNMTLYDSIPVINNIFEIHYIQNSGAAWGILANHQLLFIICTILVILFGIYIYFRCINFEQLRAFRYLLVLILAGAVGNLVDRIRFRYVIDFLYFKLINFPVFNVADCYVTIGFFLMIILVFFKYSDEDFEMIIRKK